MAQNDQVGPQLENGVVLLCLSFNTLISQDKPGIFHISILGDYIQVLHLYLK